MKCQAADKPRRFLTGVPRAARPGLNGEMLMSGPMDNIAGKPPISADVFRWN